MFPTRKKSSFVSGFSDVSLISGPSSCLFTSQVGRRSFNQRLTSTEDCVTCILQENMNRQSDSSRIQVPLNSAQMAPQTYIEKELVLASYSHKCALSEISSVDQDAAVLTRRSINNNKLDWSLQNHKDNTWLLGVRSQMGEIEHFSARSNTMFNQKLTLMRGDASLYEGKMRTVVSVLDEFYLPPLLPNQCSLLTNNRSIKTGSDAARQSRYGLACKADIGEAVFDGVMRSLSNSYNLCRDLFVSASPFSSQIEKQRAFEDIMARVLDTSYLVGSLLKLAVITARTKQMHEQLAIATLFGEKDAQSYFQSEIHSSYNKMSGVSRELGVQQILFENSNLENVSFVSQMITDIATFRVFSKMMKSASMPTKNRLMQKGVIRPRQALIESPIILECDYTILKTAPSSLSESLIPVRKMRGKVNTFGQNSCNEIGGILQARCRPNFNGRTLRKRKTQSHASCVNLNIQPIDKDLPFPVDIKRLHGRDWHRRERWLQRRVSLPPTHIRLPESGVFTKSVSKPILNRLPLKQALRDSRVGRFKNVEVQGLTCYVENDIAMKRMHNSPSMITRSTEPEILKQLKNVIRKKNIKLYLFDSESVPVCGFNFNVVNVVSSRPYLRHGKLKTRYTSVVVRKVLDALRSNKNQPQDTMLAHDSGTHAISILKNNHVCLYLAAAEHLDNFLLPQLTSSLLQLIPAESAHTEFQLTFINEMKKNFYEDVHDNLTVPSRLTQGQLHKVEYIYELSNQLPEPKRLSAQICYMLFEFLRDMDAMKESFPRLFDSFEKYIRFLNYELKPKTPVGHRAKVMSDRMVRPLLSMTHEKHTIKDWGRYSNQYVDPNMLFIHDAELLSSRNNMREVTLFGRRFFVDSENAYQQLVYLAHNLFYPAKRPSPMVERLVQLNLEAIQREKTIVCVFDRKTVSDNTSAITYFPGNGIHVMHLQGQNRHYTYSEAIHEFTHSVCPWANPIYMIGNYQEVKAVMQQAYIHDLKSCIKNWDTFSIYQKQAARKIFIQPKLYSTECERIFERVSYMAQSSAENDEITRLIAPRLYSLVETHVLEQARANEYALYGSSPKSFIGSQVCFFNQTEHAEGSDSSSFYKGKLKSEKNNIEGFPGESDLTPASKN